MSHSDPMGWRWYGQRRPDFAETPGPGQESVWDYPRPPACVRDGREVVVRFADREIARSRGAWRVLETASPPTFYLPPEDVDAASLEAAGGTSYCEWKGQARYFDVVVGARQARQAAWSYPSATGAFAPIAGFLSFYPGRVACFVDDERVRPQPGQFYGGWMTREICGPVKGEPGSGGW